MSIFLLFFSTINLFSADLIVACQQHKTPLLHLLSFYEKLDETVRENVLASLIKNGGNLNAKDRFYGATPVAYAAGHKGSALVGLLLTARADIALKNEWGEDALCYATRQICDRQSSCENLKLLVKAGADPFVQDHDKRTAFTRAQGAGRLDIISLFSSHEIRE